MTVQSVCGRRCLISEAATVAAGRVHFKRTLSAVHYILAAEHAVVPCRSARPRRPLVNGRNGMANLDRTCCWPNYCSLCLLRSAAQYNTVVR